MIRFLQILLTLLLFTGGLSPVFVAEATGLGVATPRVIAPKGGDTTWAAVPVEARLPVNRPPENDPNPPSAIDPQTVFRNPTEFSKTAHFPDGFPFPDLPKTESRRFARAPPCQK